MPEGASMHTRGLIDGLRRDADEAQAEVERLRTAIEAALANVRAAHDPAVEGHFGLLLNAESILRSALDAAP